jgi:hypothetical protein
MKIKNTLNTLNAAAGLGMIFEPNEVKELSQEVGLFILTHSEDFMEDKEAKEEVKEEAKEENKFICDVCGYEAKNANGLRLHKKKHDA